MIEQDRKVIYVNWTALSSLSRKQMWIKGTGESREPVEEGNKIGPSVMDDSKDSNGCESSAMKYFTPP